MFRRFLLAGSNLFVRSVTRSDGTLTNLIFCRLKGHSHWQNIKDTKQANDRMRAVIINRFRRKISQAVLDANGDTNAVTNEGLKKVIEECREKSIPKTVVESVLNTFKVSSDSSHFVEMVGPNRCMIYVEILTDKPRRFVAQCIPVLRKFLTTIPRLSNSYTNHFIRKGMVTVALSDFGSKDPLDIAIEIDAEEVDTDTDVFDEAAGPIEVVRFICDSTSVSSVEKKLTELGFSCLSSEVENIPNRLVELNPVEMRVYNCILEKLEQFPEIISIFSNVSQPEENK